MERLIYAIVLTLIAALATGRLSYPSVMQLLNWQVSFTQMQYAY